LIDHCGQIAGQRLHRALVHVLGKVVIKAFLVVFVFAGDQVDLHATDANLDFFRINDLNFNRLLVFCKGVNAYGGLVQGFVDGHGGP